MCICLVRPVSTKRRLTFMKMAGKTTIITTSQKLTIASLGGQFDAKTYGEGSDLGPESSTFNAANVASFLKSPSLPSLGDSANQMTLASLRSSVSNVQIDVLLTHGWPAKIIKQSKSVPPSIDSASLVPPLDDVVSASRPRYHFVAGGGSPAVFWEREPFIWSGGHAITRFISLGAFGGPTDTSGIKKPRWFYAFSIAPITPLSPKPSIPANCTENPFQLDSRTGAKRSTDDDDDGGNFIFGDVRVKRPRRDQQGSVHQNNSEAKKSTKRPPEGYICRICQSADHYIKDCPEKYATGDTGGRKPPPGYICRACGSEAHLIRDCPSMKERPRRDPVREIQPAECWFCLSNPGLSKHLIVSIGTEVYVTLAKGPLLPTDPDTLSPTHVPGGGHILIIPISHYPTLSTIPTDLAPPVLSEVDTYRAALRTMYAKYGAVPVFFEMSRLSGKGGHAHIQVVPVPESKKDGVEGAFSAYGGGQVVWEDDPLLVGYFRVDLPDGRKMVHILRPGVMFNLQFGREALAHYLALKDRADWKACSQSEDKETRDAEAFKDAFVGFDPASL
ncbi:CwfJ C-terminus 1-domain-containing protein-like protein [Cantharellus anzutake]|uniref:CwfJ C-terminus 1-domain-containing protein-like protein n=1 Tax=Cantharellus anzutake TaxID=1750568 RepID=UPI0019052BDB|nr:CwfJ C-terminus 1-domain-containing protein-like protein [Cantharellus anzutake]KAF8322867.1 CwfJ C-terminus 1-domain-containing protein-like protein [Cantharellus anzutake]